MPKNRKRPKSWHRGRSSARAARRALGSLPHTGESEVTAAEPVRLHRTHPKKGRPKKGRE